MTKRKVVRAWGIICYGALIPMALMDKNGFKKFGFKIGKIYGEIVPVEIRETSNDKRKVSKKRN